jgi:hypothetical protein
MKWCITPLYSFFGGTTEFYAFVFTGVSIAFACKHMLTLEFVGAIGAIQAIITANDIHNDVAITKVVVNNVQPADPAFPGDPH